MGQEMRAQGWEKALAEYIEKQADQPFVWGQNDCILFASRAADIILERDLLPEIEQYGNYDHDKAAEILEQFGGNIEGIFDRHFKRHENVNLAKRGDIAVVQWGAVKAAGVVDGRIVRCKTEKGLIGIPARNIVTAWNIEVKA